MNRILLNAAAAALLGSVQLAQAAEIQVSYKELPLGDSLVRRLWSDRVNDAKPLGQYSPWALVASIPIGEGRNLTVTQLWGGVVCTGQACPVRVFEGDEKLVDELLCDTSDDHRISDDGRLLTACDTAVRINRR